MSKVVFVGNIPYDVPETQLIDILNEAGPVVGFKLVTDKETGKPKGFGFCTYQDAETAASAVRNLNNREVNGRSLKIDFAENEKAEAEKKAAAGMMRTDAGGIPPGPSSKETINKVLDTVPSAQLLEVLSSLKMLAQTSPDQVRLLLLSNPQLAYAIFQAMLAMGVVDHEVMQKVPGAALPIKPEPAYYNPLPAPIPVMPIAQPIINDVQEQQKALLMEVLRLTQEQIQALPPDQRAQVQALRAQVLGQ